MSGLRRAPGVGVGLLVLSVLRMVEVRMRGPGDPSLFPEPAPRTLAEPAPLPVLDTRARDAVFYEKTVASLINPPESTGMGFWSVNPYVGCEFGCTYCYARFTHRYTVERAESDGRLHSADMGAYQGEDAWKAFEHRIFVKRRESVLAAMERDLVRVNRRCAGGEYVEIVLGTATDPYQPAERAYRLSRAILERLARERGLQVSIISKSPLVCRDIDILTEIQRYNGLSIHVSLITTDARLIKLLEVRSPMPHARLRGLHKLAEAGLNAGVIVAPVLPGINDTVAQLEELIVAAKDSGARFVFPSALRLYSSIRDHFLPVIDRHFPELSEKYREAYRGLGHAPRPYAAALRKRFGEIAARRGIAVKDPAAVPAGESRRKPGTQLGLW